MAQPVFDSNNCASQADMSDSCSGLNEVQDGPSFEKGQCCYALCKGPVLPCGRPFVIGGGARIAAAVVRADWLA